MANSTIITTTRFGQVAVSEGDLITFGEGILGFSDLTQFVLLDDPNDDIFAWLQSTQEPAIAFPVLEPELFVEKYQPTLAKSDTESLHLKANEKPSYFCIVTIPEDPTKMTANMKAPVIVNVREKRARQCVLQDNSMAIREPIFARLQQRVVLNPDKSIKSQSTGLDVAIKLPERGTEVSL
jgi:flagellar assembly factor FliW